jgi:RHS repeat-associated protein
VQGGSFFEEKSGAGENKYLYNKKELQEELGEYDYSKRFYDPTICRFTTIDPLATEYPWYTQYQYAGNEVPNAIDRDGLEPAYYNNGRITIQRDGGLQRPLAGGDLQALKTSSASKTEVGAGAFKDGRNPVRDVINILGSLGEAVNDLAGLNGNKSVGDKIQAAATIITAIPIEGGEGSGEMHGIPDNATVVRGGTNTPGQLASKLTETHPSGVQGASVECGTCSVKELSSSIPHGKIGVTTAGEIRAVGGNVIRTSGNSPNHATITNISPEAASKLLNPVIKNPNKN